MSSYDYYSTTESETDEEYEQELEKLEEEILWDENSTLVWDLMHDYNIRSPLSGPIDGKVLNDWLHPTLKMEDVVYKQFLRYDGHVALHDRISPQRIDDIRKVAKAVAEHYNPFCAKYTSYIDGVTAHIIKYHYKL